MSFQCPVAAGGGLFARHVDQLNLRNVRIAATKGPALDIYESRRITLDMGSYTTLDTVEPIDVDDDVTS